MRIAVTAEGADLNAEVGSRFGTSAYFIIVDSETLEFEALPHPGASAKRGVGIQAVVLAISKEVDAVLTGYASPAVRKHLSDAGVDVVTGLSGTVRQVVERYAKGELGERAAVGQGATEARMKKYTSAILEALRRSASQFAGFLPIMIGVVLLIGLFNAFVSREALASVFSGGVALDSLWGACFGSILAGNPITSYIIGGELLEQGVSLFAVTALIVAWVTVGVVQIPAEMSALGARFALVRNAVCFVFAILVAIITVLILNLIAG